MACTSPSSSRTTAIGSPSMTTWIAPTSGSSSSEQAQLRAHRPLTASAGEVPSTVEPGVEVTVCRSSASIARHQPLRRRPARRSAAPARRRTRARPAGVPRPRVIAAGLQVEQLLVVEPAGGAGVAGADDLAGLDLQVRHRVGAGAVGEHQVAVQLVGVGALGAGPDQDVADPHRVRAVALQRALVGDVAACSAAPRGRRTAGAPGAGRRRRSRCRPAGRRRRGPRTPRSRPPGPGRRRATPAWSGAVASRPSRTPTWPRCTASGSHSCRPTSSQLRAVADQHRHVARRTGRCRWCSSTTRDPGVRTRPRRSRGPAPARRRSPSSRSITGSAGSAPAGTRTHDGAAAVAAAPARPARSTGCRHQPAQRVAGRHRGELDAVRQLGAPLQVRPATGRRPAGRAAGPAG